MRQWYPLIQKSYKPGPINRYIVKENNIGSAGSDILCDKQTDRHPDTFI